MNYDESMDYERYRLDERDETVSDEVYVIHDGYRELSRTYSFDTMKRLYNAEDEKNGIEVGLIIEDDIDPMDWEYTKTLMTKIK
jgi:hypothetical protein